RADDRAHLRVPACECGERVGDFALVDPGFALPGILFGDGDEIHQPARGDEIMHEVPLRPHPDLRRSLQLDMTETFGRPQAAIRHAAGEAPAPPTEQRVAHGRMDAVGPDEHVGRYRSAVLESRFDPIVAVDQMLETTAEVYAVGGESAHKRAMEVGAMKC